MKDIFITHLNIHHLRHLKNITIELSKDTKKHLILTGKNGSGKTSVLEAISAIFEGGKYDKGKGSPLVCEFNSVEEWKEQFHKGKVLVAFQKANRFTPLAKPEGPKKIDLKTRYELDESPTTLFLQYLVNLQVEKTFARDDGETETVTKIEQWFTMFENMLRELFEDATLKLRFDRKNFNFSILTKDRDSFDFCTLSDGYLAALNIFCDVLMRMEKQRTNGYNMQGVVLIDDIETHLCVELQQIILPLLANFFSNIQFIVSTHSPFVLNSLENAVVYDLENRIRGENLPTHTYDSLAKRYADINKYSDQIKRMIDEYEKLLSKGEKTEREQFRLLELRSYLTWIIHKVL